MVASLLLGALILTSARADEASCRPDFPYREGWLGGDAAYSVPLAGGKSLWLFGDTFVGTPEMQDRSSSTMIANSLGLSRCEKGRWSISYHWKLGADGKPAAFFETGDKSVRYWPFDGYVYHGKIFVALARIRTIGTGPFDFENAGTDLAVISPGAGGPARWTVAVSTLWPDGAVHVGSSIAMEGAWVYLFSVEARAKVKRVVLARMPLRGPPRLEYLAKDGAWKPGLALEDALTVMDEAATEMTVRRHGDRWVAVYPAPALPSAGIAMRTSKKPAGPWSQPRIVAPFPETAPGAPPDKDTFCYAAKEHAQLAYGDALTVTYACNSFNVEQILKRMDLYRPRVLSLRVPVD